MEITLGDKIKINGEAVPEYLLKALYEALRLRYAVSALTESDKLPQSCITQAPIQACGSKPPSSKYLIR